MNYKIEVYSYTHGDLLLTIDDPMMGKGFGTGLQNSLQGMLNFLTFNIQVSILTNLSINDTFIIRQDSSTETNSTTIETVLKKKEVEFGIGSERLTILKLWIQSTNKSDDEDLSKIPEWWKDIELTKISE